MTDYLDTESNFGSYNKRLMMSSLSALKLTFKLIPFICGQNFKKTMFNLYA